MTPEKSKFEKLSEALYSRTRYRDPRDERSNVEPLETPAVEERWQSPKLDEILSRERIEPKATPFMKKFFVFALLFFIAAILLAGFIFFGGTNFISSKNVDIEAVGPTFSRAGEAIELGVTIKNGNNSALETATLSIHYPSGTRDPQSTDKTLTFGREELGVIGAGDEAVRNVRFVLIGSPGEQKEIKFSVEYKVLGSNATFYKDKVYPVTIGSAPLGLNISAPEHVNSGADFTTTASISLNSTEILKNVMLRAEYPYGFTAVSALPPAVSENNVWRLGDLVPGMSKKIEILGRLTGENEDLRTFRFYVGVDDTVILSAQNTIAIEKPSIALSASFNGESVPVYTAPAESAIGAVVKFRNNMPEKILNPSLEARLSGEALDKNSVVAQNGGQYNKTSGHINWSILSPQGLRELLPGEGGATSFIFSALPESVVPASSREIKVELIFSGIQAGGAPLTVAESYTVKVASQVVLSSRAGHSLGPFANTGPIPPKVGTATTYGITLAALNTQSNIADAKVTARLGQNVKWVGVHTSGDENISYDEKTNIITWELGTLAAGTGFSTPSRTAAFQVSLTPAMNQLGTAPVLVSNIALTGYDHLSDKTINITNPNLTTRISTDPAFIQGDDIVVK